MNIKKLGFQDSSLLAFAFFLSFSLFNFSAVIANENIDVRSIDLLGEETYPEGIAIHQRTGDIFVGGLAQGEIQKISNGEVTRFKTSHENGVVNTIGLAIDSKRDRLFATNTDFFNPMNLPSVLIYDTNSGDLLQELFLPSDGLPHFFNDIDVDKKGNAYITDSFSPTIWKIDPGLNEITPFVVSELFAVFPGSFNLNGIVVTPNQRHIIASVPTLDSTVNGKLFRIRLKDAKVDEIQIEGIFSGVDGMVFKNSKTMYGPGNGLKRVRFNHNYSKAKVKILTSALPYLDLATTAAIYKGRLYVVNSQLDHYVPIFNNDTPPELPFQLVTFDLHDLKSIIQE